jgi:hypothetical protein
VSAETQKREVFFCEGNSYFVLAGQRSLRIYHERFIQFGVYCSVSSISFGGTFGIAPPHGLKCGLVYPTYTVPHASPCVVKLQILISAYKAVEKV